MKKNLLFLSIILAFGITPVFADGLTLFNTEIAAQNHCPYDEVVWLNLPTGIWHPKSGRWYGATKNGSFVCKEEAAMAGDRGSLNGQ
jgi:hypothetical protein